MYKNVDINDMFTMFDSFYPSKPMLRNKRDIQLEPDFVSFVGRCIQKNRVNLSECV